MYLEFIWHFSCRWQGLLRNRTICHALIPTFFDEDTPVLDVPESSFESITLCKILPVLEMSRALSYVNIERLEFSPAFFSFWTQNLLGRSFSPFPLPPPSEKKKKTLNLFYEADARDSVQDALYN